MSLPKRDDYEVARQSFDGDQLRIARELRCLTQTELAKRSAEGSGRTLTAAAVSQFESGTAVPSAATIEVLTTALGVEPDFLTTAAADDEAHLPAFFRSLRATPAKDRKRARNIAQLVHRVATVVGEHVEMPARRIPVVECDPYALPDERRSQAEAAAAEVRRAWRIHRGPIEDVVGTIEAHGVICARFRFNEERVDAFSVAFSRFPVAVLAADKDKWDRSRFDAAHELGHLVMHDEAAGVPEAERQANEFAAALLMPASDIRTSLPNRADWAHLLQLKETWGTSVASLLYRARTLETMTERTYIGATKVMAARGWKRHEPLNRPAESPRVLSERTRAARAAGLSSERLRRAAAIPRDLFDEVFADVAP
jgi:Zn-dependent peptidase ImmA (M78 family)/transcriptional regulator with XRE-family HTH domain